MHGRSRLTWQISAAVAFASASLSCGSEPTITVNDVVGQYGLVEVQGSPLPHIVEVGASCDFLLEIGIVGLRFDSVFTLVFAEAMDCTKSGGEFNPTLGRGYSGRFSLEGSRIRVSFEPQGPTFDGTVIPADRLDGTLRGAGAPYPDSLELRFTFRSR